MKLVLSDNSGRIIKSIYNGIIYSGKRVIEADIGKLSSGYIGFLLNVINTKLLRKFR